MTLLDADVLWNLAWILPLAAILFDEPRLGSDDFSNAERFPSRPPVDIPCKNLSIRLTGGHAPLLRGLIRGRKRRKTLLKMARRRLENA